MKYKKLKVYLVGVLSIILVEFLGYLLKIPEFITKRIVDSIVTLSGIFIGAQGFVDGITKGKTATIDHNNNAKKVR